MREALVKNIENQIAKGENIIIVDGRGDGISFKKYPLICTKCKKGKVSQENGVCTYVMCRFQNKSVF